MLLAFNAGAADQPLLITLQLQPNRTLPSLPVAIRFTASNTSRTDALFPASMAIEITQAGGPTLVGTWGDPPKYWTGALPHAYQGHDTIKAGETRSFLDAIDGSLCNPSVFGPLKPGVYNIRIALADEFSPDHADRHTPAETLGDLTAGAKNLVMTNAVTLHVEEPQGEDAAAWQLIQKAGGNWCLLVDREWALAEDIWLHHRSSRYAPYAAANLPPTYAAQREANREWIRKTDPQNPLLAWYDLGDVNEHERKWGDALYTERNLQKALDEAAKARDGYAALIKKTRNEQVQAEAMELARHVMTAEQIIKRDRVLSSHDAPAPGTAKPVVPLVSCGNKEDGNAKTVTFGYNNPNAFSVPIVIGTRNHFDPAPADRGQPTFFLPGQHHAGLTLKLQAKDTIAWTLDGKTLTVSNRDDDRCGNGDDERK
jgi:hypothetical protein